MTTLALDLRTMYFLLMLSSLMAGVCVLVLNVPPGERQQSARQWAMGSILVACGLALIGLRDIIPLYVSATVGNVLAMWGFLLFFSAYRLLMQKPFNSRILIGIALAYALLFHCLVDFDVAVRYRIGVVSLTLVLLAIAMLHATRLPHRAAPYTRSARFMMQMFYGIVLVTSAIRGTHSVLFESGATLIFEPTTVQVLNFLGNFFALIGAGIAYLLTQNALTYASLAEVFSNDVLTGVRNRRNFLDMAERDWALSQRLWRPLTVMMLDLDHLKHINNDFGHAAGDDVLSQFGKILRDNVRDVDLVGRHDGAKFCIVLADSTPESARHSAERIRQEFGNLEILGGGKRIPLGVSIGIAGSNAGDSRSMQELLNAADNALAEAKSAGRNCIRQEPA